MLPPLPDVIRFRFDDAVDIDDFRRAPLRLPLSLIFHFDALRFSPHFDTDDVDATPLHFSPDDIFFIIAAFASFSISSADAAVFDKMPLI